IVEIVPSDIKMVQKREAIMLRDNLVPIIRLNQVLGISSDNGKDSINTVVIVRNSEQLVGLVVDSIIGQQEIVQKPLDKYLSFVQIANSATILGDGTVALILNENY